MVNPQEFLMKLESTPYNFKLEGYGLLSFHLGRGFSQDSSGTLCMDPEKYVDKMECSYEHLFHCKPSQKVTLPLEKRDHPELDISDFLDSNDMMILSDLSVPYWSHTVIYLYWEIQYSIRTNKAGVDTLFMSYGFNLKILIMHMILLCHFLQATH